jgi:hypothetical protein
MGQNNKIIFAVVVVVTLSVAIVLAIFGYFILQINHNLNILLSETNKINQSTTESNQQQQQQIQEEQQNIINTSENAIETSQNNNTNVFLSLPSTSSLSSSSSSSSSTTSDSQNEKEEERNEGGFEIFPSNFIQTALIPEPSLVISVILRTAIIATLVFVIVKWLGGKGIGQLSPFGLIIIIGLGSAVGDPMIYKDISIPQALAAVIIVIIFFKIIDYTTFKSKRFRGAAEPKPIRLAEKGSIMNVNLKKARMTKEDFEIEMRLKGIEKISDVKFAQLETNGQISFIKRDKSNYDY